MTVSMNAVALVHWSHESHELSWDDPVEVSVLDLLVVLVLLCVEGFEVIPAEADALLQTFQAVEYGALVEAVTLACVSERLEALVVDLELSEGLVNVHLQDHDHECTHQEARIGDLGWVCAAAIVIDSGGSLE